MKTLRCAFFLLLLVGLFAHWPLPTAPVASAAPPAGFDDSLVTNVPNPTGLAFLPDQRLLITSQDGRLWLNSGTTTSTVALDLRTRICSDFERGLLGVAVDPQFASSGFIYLYYTFKKHNSCASNDAEVEPVNRVSRFELGGNSVLTATETVLIDNIPSTNGNHNGGDVQFGKDGHLYVSIGDAGCDYLGDSGCAGQNDVARDRNVLLGKIVRITRDGGIPADNPFTGANTARCNSEGRTSAGLTCREIFATGLRNPYRIAFDPNATGTRFFINDVGQGRREEVNLGQAGADYGWNLREGHCDNGSDNNCSPPVPAGLTDPIHDYTRSQGCVSITGGAFVPNGVWPASYNGSYLYADYGCGKMFLLRPNGAQFVATSEQFFSYPSVIAMTFGPHAGSQALYYTSYNRGGEVRRLSYGDANRPPTASISAEPQAGDPPLSVAFSAQGSSDPDGEALTYSWSFGDGATGSGLSVTHVYTRSGVFTAMLTVRDPRGATGSASLRIDVGNTPPTARILTPSPELRFRVGQQITLSGTASDREDSTLPRLTWEVVLHHITPENRHTHPILQPTEGTSVTIRAPLPEDLQAAEQGYLEIRLTASDSTGLTSVVTQELRPNLVPITFRSTPAERTLTVNEVSLTAPRTLSSWEGHTLKVTAQPGIDSAGVLFLFRRWLDSDSAGRERSIVTPAAPISYTAVYSTLLSGEYERASLPLICRLGP
jgi:glucose/arabinose dehydrogenase